jgi:hypothetical protein
MFARHARIALATLGLATMAAPAAVAQESIGDARVIQRDVAGSLGDNHRRVSQGDQVFADEVITTSVASLAQLELVDLTSMSIGPSAQVKLDRFVYRKAGKPTMVINVARGAFRFVSAPGDHKSYEVRTPTATIGVRGTRFDVLSTQGRTDVVLHDGAIDLCRAGSGNCRRLHPGQTSTITPKVFTRPAPFTPDKWSFEKTLAAAGLSVGKAAAASRASTSSGDSASRLASSAPAPSSPSPDPGPPSTDDGRGLGGNVGGGPRNRAVGGSTGGDGGGRDVNGGGISR